MLLICVGFTIGAVGTLIGVGGGFLLIPILLFLFPEQSNVWISSVSMFVVAMNSTSGSVTYYLKKRVHMGSALAFMVASFPGSAIGVWAARLVSRNTYEFVFGLAIIVYSVVVYLRKTGPESGMHAESVLSSRFYFIGCVISFFVGFMASFFGIGGGVVHVPLMSHVLGFPVHLATGTSHMILAVTAWFTTVLHFIAGDIQLNDVVIWQVGLPAILGAQVGARLSGRVSGQAILRLLAVALFILGIRVLWESTR